MSMRFGTSEQDYKTGCRQLKAWHNRPHKPTPPAVALDEAVKTTYNPRTGMSTTWRGSGFYNGR